MGLYGVGLWNTCRPVQWGHKSPPLPVPKPNGKATHEQQTPRAVLGPGMRSRRSSVISRTKENDQGRPPKPSKDKGNEKLAQSCRLRCLLKCRLLEHKRTRYAHSEFFRF